MEDKYPELSSRRHFLHAVYGQLHQAHEAGEWELLLQLPDIARIGEEIGFNQPRTFAKFKELVDLGYLRARLGRGMHGGPTFSLAIVEGLTNLGLLEIGEIPDPRQRLIDGFEGAIREIEADPGMNDQEKKRRVDWGHQAIEFVRGLGVAGAARIFFGA
jgi:hypothetical protein